MKKILLILLLIPSTAHANAVGTVLSKVFIDGPGGIILLLCGSALVGWVIEQVLKPIGKGATAVMIHQNITYFCLAATVTYILFNFNKILSLLGIQ